MRRSVSFGMIALVAACGSSALPPADHDASTSTTPDTGSTIDSGTDATVDARPADAVADTPLDSTPTSDSTPGDAISTQDAPVDSAPADVAGDTPVDSQGDAVSDSGSLSQDAASPDASDSATAETSTTTDAGAGTQDALADVAADVPSDVPATLPTDTTFTIDGVTYPAYSMFDWQSLPNLSIPVRIFRVSLWADVALTSPMCTVARQTKKAGSREVLVEIHRALGADAADTIPLGTYTRGSTGPDGNTRMVTLIYRRFAPSVCNPPLESADPVQPSQAAGSITVSAVSPTQTSISFALQVDTTLPPRKSFAGTVTTTTNCPNPGIVTACSP